MAMSQAVCDSFILECLQGIHVLATDSLKLALYSASAVLSYATTVYAATNEVVGAGYAAGGVALVVTPTYPKVVNRICLLDFVDVLINPVNISTRYGLVYNSSKANRAIGVIDFGSLQTAPNTFAVTWPLPNEQTAAFRWSAAR